MQKKRFQRPFKVVFLLLLLAVFWLKGVIFLDPDFGWHLRMGKLIYNFGIPKTDPFSYTMPSFPFIDHEWLTNLILSRLYPSLGNSGLSVLFSLLALSSLLISISNPLSRKTSKKGLDFTRRITIPFLLGASTFILYSGVRPQVLSWLLLAILLMVVLNEEIFRRWRYFLPALFIFWVNLHGSFAVGIVSLYLVLFLRTVRVKRVDAKDLFVAGGSLLATFINPYGPRIWHEVWLQASDASLRWTIAEWMPAFFSINIPFTVLAPLSLVFLWKYRGRLYLEEKGLYFFFLAQAFSSLRHIPLWVIVTLPLLEISLNYFYEDLDKIPFAISRFDRLYKLALAFCILVLVFATATSIRDASLLKEENFYPKNAVIYLRQNLPQGQIFSYYGWGGYLIWKLPEKKVFIDGRMPSWRWSAGIPGESDYAMKLYKNLLLAEVSYKDVFAKYGVDTVVWPVKLKPSPFESLAEKLKPFLNQLGMRVVYFDIYKELEKDGWVKVYEDSVAVIYKNLS